ncbi:hypothetical protein L7F22_027725, partial [Adiantum nelumboides]|nr:hypothetical protein [Adiantum nelumboides]
DFMVVLVMGELWLQPTVLLLLSGVLIRCWICQVFLVLYLIGQVSFMAKDYGFTGVQLPGVYCKVLDMADMARPILCSVGIASIYCEVLDITDMATGLQFARCYL